MQAKSITFTDTQLCASQSTNFTGDALSDKELSKFASKLREFHELGDLDVPDMVAQLARRSIWTRFGEKEFDYQVVKDEDLGGDEAITLVTDSHVRVRLSQSTYERACALDRRARWTIAHELAHCALHKNVAPLARSRQQTAPRVVPHYVSVERQAEVFTGSYLITEAMVAIVTSPSELADRFLISLSAADVRWEKRRTPESRESVASGFKKLRMELGQAGAPTMSEPSLLFCPGCGQPSLMPLGVKYLCLGICDKAYESFADGDL